MSTLIMNDATTKTMAVISQNGLTADLVDVAAAPALRLTAQGKHTLAGASATSRDRHLQSVVKRRVDATTGAQLEAGCNLTVWSSNSATITAADKYDVIWGIVCAINGVTTAMDAGTKSRVDKLFAGVNLF